MEITADDALYIGATIHTCAGPRPAGALLVRHGRIAAVGDRDEVDAATPAGTRRVDLRGLTVVPGFNDCHCHVLWLGMDLGGLYLGRDAVRTIADIRSAVRTRAASTRAGGWVSGAGYDQNALEERRHPTRADLDDVAGGRPVVLHHTSGHVLTCNSASLRAAGITRQTDTPPGGEIERDPTGEPTGVLKEAAMDLVAHVLPAPTVEQGRDAVLAATRHLASLGITSATDLNTGDTADITPQLEMYRRAATSGEQRTRLGLCPNIRHVVPADGTGVRAPREFELDTDPHWLAVRATKIFSDGALSTRTAALREAYAGDPGNRGILIWPDETLGRMIERAHRAGWQIATHALGDRAVEIVLDCLAAALEAHPRRDHRHRIEHLMLLDRDLVHRIGRLGVVPVLQPDIFRLGDGYVAALGRERAQDVIPLDLFCGSGITVAFSSDAPVIPADPLAVIRSAAERVTPSGEVLGREHVIPPMRAIERYTAGSAYATRTEGDLGTLEPGKWADFTVLSADPAGTPAEGFETIRVVRTVVGGHEVYQA